MRRSDRRVAVAVVVASIVVAGAPWTALAGSGSPSAPPPTAPLPPLPGADPGQPASTVAQPAPTTPVATSATATASPVTLDAFVAVTDDTGLLNVEVPATWTDVDTRPIVADDGSVRPSITAAPDWDDFLNRFDAPGLIYSAFAFTADHESIFTQFAFDGYCRDGGRAPYSDGAFVGQVQAWTACDGTLAELRVVVADPPDNSFTALIVVQIPTPADLAAYDHVLQTFNADATVGMPTATVPVATTDTSTVSPPPVPPSTVPVVTVPVVTVPMVTVPSVTETTAGPAVTVPTATVMVPVPPGPVPITALPVVTVPPVTETTTAVTVPAVTAVNVPTAITSPAPGFQTVTDGSGRLSVQVPLTWSDVNGNSGTDADGSTVVALSAAPDLRVFSDTYDGPGLLLREAPYTRDPSVFLTNFTFSECTDAGLTASTREGYVGVEQTWTNCGGTTAEIHVVAANPLDGRQVTAVLVIQTITPTDDEALQVALSTFQIR